MNITPCGHEFRTLIQAWNEYSTTFREEDKQREKEARIHTLLNSQDFIMYFTYNNEVYASNEDGRMTFAIMAGKTEVGYEDMMFSAVNLSKAAREGKMTEELIRFKDLGGIKIIAQDVAAKKLMSGKVNPPDQLSTIKNDNGLQSLDKDTV